MIQTILFPLMRKYLKLILSMIAVSSLGIALMVGLSGAYAALDYSLNTYVSDYHYADAALFCDVTDLDIIEDLENISGVKKVDTRGLADVQARLENGRLLTVRAFSYDILDFQRFYTWEMNESAEHPNIAMEYKFARDNAISTGDLIEIKLDGEYQTACVGRLISSPECLSVQKDTYSWGENSDFGYIFIPYQLLLASDYKDEHYGEYNQLLFFFDDWADGDAVLEQTKTMLGDTEIYNSYLYEESAVSKKIEINLEPIETLSILLPLVFFINMILVVSLFLAQIVRQCRRDIGILRALGFRQIQIRTLFSCMTLFITSVACIIGFAIGVILADFAGRMYADYFPLPQLYSRLDIRLCVLAVVITTLAGQVSSVISTLSISRILPTEAMSREVPSSVNTPESVQNFLGRFSPEIKFGITSIFRNVKRFVFSVLCIAVSITLILSAVAFNESKDFILKDLYENRIHYDSQIFLDERPDNEEFERIHSVEGVSATELLLYYEADLTFGDNTVSALINGVETDTEMITVLDRAGKALEIPEEGIVLERHTAEELGAQAGDVIEVNGFPVTVSALSEQSVNRIQYSSIEQVDAWGESDQYAVLCIGGEEQELLETVSELEDYSYTTFTHLMREGNEKTFATYSLGVYILIAFAVLMGLIIVYNTTQTNLYEQKKELAVMRAIGFQVRDISNIWMLQSMKRSSRVPRP